MLKALCDLYGLRKDEFDRVNNEASYLASMNAARSDKERMLDYVRPGRDRRDRARRRRRARAARGSGSPTAEIIGVDLSQEAIAALEARARAGNHGGSSCSAPPSSSPSSWHRRRVDSVVFCSILHEVYSYTERGGTKFHLESVRDVDPRRVGDAAPGGRIVIRDGVMPPPGTRRIRFLAPDARPTFDLYVAQFEGRKIAYRELAADRVELSARRRDGVSLHVHVGPASFPYEVRELYGILPYDDYVAALVDVGRRRERREVVEIPAQLRSYLQPGYRDNLAGKIELTDEHDRPVELPDSNCLIVIERR